MRPAPDPGTHQHPILPLQLLELRSRQSLQTYHYQPGTVHRKEDTILRAAVAIAMHLKNYGNHFESSLDRSNKTRKTDSGLWNLQGSKIEGYDFNQGVNYSELLRSMVSTGFQASNLGDAIQVVNQMV
ncbi:hypothetical protein Vadar_005605 [Vaccinium darrowii]|uniref:Uncharacterized protein n=1 Tax=Vaccinium darrowii TaxID=229202 RepID=A0ACB7YBU2_9ERIC|nr:hypothetical protein Vadar_005605 [Vaccinium darrowii]